MTSEKKVTRWQVMGGAIVFRLHADEKKGNEFAFRVCSYPNDSDVEGQNGIALQITEALNSTVPYGVEVQPGELTAIPEYDGTVYISDSRGRFEDFIVPIALEDRYRGRHYAVVLANNRLAIDFPFGYVYL